MRIARVFPTKTSMSPDDELAFFTEQPQFIEMMPEVDEVHISVTFTWDIPKAERMEKAWRVLGVPVRVGGVAVGSKPCEFVPGMYLKKGMTITSRGCNNKCWFCDVWRREGKLREMAVQEGHNVLDNNILGCSDTHVTKLFEMLKQQKERPTFTGGLEAKILKPWHAEALLKLNPKTMYFAYDTKDDYEPLIDASKLLHTVGFSWTTHAIGCYCLIGYPKDTFEKAEKRLNDLMKLGYFPYAMLYRDHTGDRDPAWVAFQREWLRPRIVATKYAVINTARKEQSHDNP